MTMVCEDVIHRTLKNGEIKHGYYMHPRLMENLSYELLRVSKNWDAVILYDGEEGAAKTTHACAIAHWMSHEKGVPFGINNIIFTQEQFEKAINDAPPYTNIVWDEFVLSGLATEVLTKVQITLVKKMTMIRKKRLVIHLVIPYMFMLARYFAIGRTRCLIHVYSPDNLTRGSFQYFSKPKKKMLYFQGKKFWDYSTVRCDFDGDFSDTFGLFFNPEEYEKKKDAATQEVGTTAREDRTGSHFAKLLVYLREKYNLTWDELAIHSGYKGTTTIIELIKRHINGKWGGVLVSTSQPDENNGTHGGESTIYHTKLIMPNKTKQIEID